MKRNLTFFHTICLLFVFCLVFTGCGSSSNSENPQTPSIEKISIVNEEQWNESFDLSNINNFEYIWSDGGYIDMVKRDDSTLYRKSDDGTSIYEHYYVHTQTSYYHYNKVNSGDWTKSVISKNDYDSEFSEWASDLSLKFDYAEFTYNSQIKKYETESYSLSGMILSDVSISFQDYKLCSITYTRNDNEYSFVCDYGGVELSVPQI